MKRRNEEGRKRAEIVDANKDIEETNRALKVFEISQNLWTTPHYEDFYQPSNKMRKYAMMTMGALGVEGAYVVHLVYSFKPLYTTGQWERLSEHLHLHRSQGKRRCPPGRYFLRGKHDTVFCVCTGNGSVPVMFGTSYVPFPSTVILDGYFNVGKVIISK
jgi:hypothetical protein